MKHGTEPEKIRDQILEMVARYYEAASRGSDFSPGRSRVPYGGRIFDNRELKNLVEASLEFWLTQGRFTREFEQELARFLGIRHCLFVNSGSSANLLGFMALTSPVLGDRAIGKGDEIITTAACFPTTVTPIIQFGAVPVFVDIQLPSCNADPELLEEALSSRTKAVMLTHTLGNPFDIGSVKAFCQKHGLWLVEDNCDALGSRYRGQVTGTFGHVGTSSFYPSHHMTTGEGGAVYTDLDDLAAVLASMRDWGRDCVCPPGADDTCGKRFAGKHGLLPEGYDHKYVYSHFGYNLKATDLQAAIGVAQLEKLDNFIEARRRNWKTIREGLNGLEDIFIMPEPAVYSEPSWFGFMLILREAAPFSRSEIIRHLEESGVQTRMLFAGNLVRHPCFDRMRESGEGHRIAGVLTRTDQVMKSAFWFGVYPGLSRKMLDHIISSVRSFAQK